MSFKANELWIYHPKWYQHKTNIDFNIKSKSGVTSIIARYGKLIKGFGPTSDNQCKMMLDSILELISQSDNEINIITSMATKIILVQRKIDEFYYQFDARINNE